MSFVICATKGTSSLFLWSSSSPFLLLCHRAANGEHFTSCKLQKAQLGVGGWVAGGGGLDLQTFALRVTGSIPNPVQILMRGRGGWGGVGLGGKKKRERWRRW